jgi:hypothetical protein
MFTPTRNEARRLFFEAWAKYRRGEPLAGMEAIALQVIVEHPEYHALLDDPDGNLEREYPPERGQMNPFLHLSLHMAIEEQLSIDQPPGIVGYFQRLAAKAGSAHDAKHAILEALAEMIWLVQREGKPFDSEAYLESLARKLG